MPKIARQLAALFAFLGASLVITLIIALAIPGVGPTPSGYTVTATFDDVTQLFPGDPVLLAGVPVGQVESLHLVNGRAQVRFTVDRSVQLAAQGTVVEVRWRNLIAQRELYLDPGPITAKTTAYLPMNGHAVITKTESAVDVGSFLDAFGPLITAASPGQVNSIFDALASALDGNGSAVDSLISNLTNIVSVFAGRGQQIAGMVGDYKTLTGVLAQRDSEISTMLDNVSLLTQSFQENTQLFDSLVGNLSTSVPDLNALLTRSQNALNQIIGGASELITGVNSKLRAIVATFEGVPPAFNALFSAVSHGDYLQVDITCLQSTAFPCTAGGYQIP